MDDSAYLGGARSALLPGLYDTDAMTDLAVYDPTTFTAVLL